MSRLGYELGLVVLIFGGFLFAGGGNDLSTIGGAVMASDWRSESEARS